MILGVKVNNHMVYSSEVNFSLSANREDERLINNVYEEANFKSLKSACVYGANNSGKTCFIRAIDCIVRVISGKSKSLQSNLFSKNSVVNLGISFCRNHRAFSYEFKCDTEKDEKGKRRGFIYECLKELFMDADGNQTENLIFIKDTVEENYFFKDGDVPIEIMKGVSNGDILIHSVNESIYTGISQYKDALEDFANNVDVVNAVHLSYKKTTEALRDDDPMKEDIVDLIKLADLDIQDFGYVKRGGKNEDAQSDSNNNDDAEGDATPRTSSEVLRLFSVHHGVAIPSFLIDSIGTAKVMGLASYIVDALQNGKTLVVDELDSGLHFKLTRAIIALFNNSANEKGGQLIFSTHDVALLDCKRLFRQDQIWFVCKDRDSVCLYSLAELGYSDEELTSSDYALQEKYRRGALGLIPNPDFLSIILDDYDVDESEETM